MTRPRARESFVFWGIFLATLAAAYPGIARQSQPQQPSSQRQKPAGRPAPTGGPSSATGSAADATTNGRWGRGARAQANPFAGTEDQKLLSLAGAWQEDVRYAGDAAGSPSGKGRWIARPAFGLYLVMNYEGSGPEGDYHAHGVMAYDHEERAFRLWWFDDAGGIGEYTGTWKDANTLVFEHKKNSGGRPFRERITYTLRASDQLETKVEQAWGTEAYKFYMEASAGRVQLPEGKGWGEKLGQQQPRGSRIHPPDATPQKPGNPPR